MTLTELFTEIANNMRTYLGTTDKIAPSDFPAKISEVYDTGNSDGYNSGYADGQEDSTGGYTDADMQIEYDSGYADGFYDGYQDGYNSCRVENGL